MDVNDYAGCLEERVIVDHHRERARSYIRAGDEVKEPDEPITVFKTREDSRRQEDQGFAPV